MDIPHIIHHIWFQGEKSIPSLQKKLQHTCRHQHPDYQFRFWDKTSILTFFQEECSHYLSTYQKFPLMIQKIDFAKYALLHKYGGIYLDMDVRCLRSIDSLTQRFPEARFICSKLPINQTETELISSTTAASIGKTNACWDCALLNNGILLSIPQHSFLTLLLEDISHTNPQLFSITREAQITYTTGPAIFSQTMRKYLRLHHATMDSTHKGRNNRIDHVAILPAKFLEPCVSWDHTCHPGKIAIFDHQHQNSWYTGPLLMGIKIYYQPLFYKIMIVVTLIVLVMGLAILLLYNHRRFSLAKDR